MDFPEHARKICTIEHLRSLDICFDKSYFADSYVSISFYFYRRVIFSIRLVGLIHLDSFDYSISNNLSHMPVEQTTVVIYTPLSFDWQSFIHISMILVKNMRIKQK